MTTLPAGCIPTRTHAARARTWLSLFAATAVLCSIALTGNEARAQTPYTRGCSPDFSICDQPGPPGVFAVPVVCQAPSGPACCNGQPFCAPETCAVVDGFHDSSTSQFLFEQDSHHCCTGLQRPCDEATELANEIAASGGAIPADAACLEDSFGELVLAQDQSGPGCTFFCGDGVLNLLGNDLIPGTQDDEACDDGNYQNGDGCDALCQVEAPVGGVAFAQLDWYDPDGNLVQADSLYGQMSWTYDPDATMTHYLNVNVSLSNMGPTSWVIQNLPLFAVDNGDFSTRSEGTYFNLAELGLTAGTDLPALYYSANVETSIQLTGPGPASMHAPVVTLQRHASDSLAESPNPGPFTDPGAPEGVKLDAAPTKVNPARDVRGVQEGPLKCTAGSFARSIDWLNREHDLGIEKNAQEIYHDLIALGVSTVGQGGPNSRDEWIEYKNSYARQQSNDRIVTKVWERSAAEVDDTEGVAQETGDFAEWLKREIMTEDVELAYFYPGNAHIVTVLEVYEKDGESWVKFRDDERQGDDTLGDGVGGPEYPAVKHAKIYQTGGQYRFGSDQNTIYFGVSESVEPAPRVPALGGPGLVLLAFFLLVSAALLAFRRAGRVGVE